MAQTSRVCTRCGEPVIWESLRVTGVQGEGDDWVEQRACPCGSTLCAPIPPPAFRVFTPPPEKMGLAIVVAELEALRDLGKPARAPDPDLTAIQKLFQGARAKAMGPRDAAAAKISAVRGGSWA